MIEYEEWKDRSYAYCWTPLRSFNRRSEIELIHNSALRILEEMGMEIQNQQLLKDLADFGLLVDFDQERVRFPTNIVEKFLSDVDKYDWENHVPQVGANAGLYHGLFHDPASGDLLPWTEDRLAYYFALARKLEHIDGVSMLGSRLPVPQISNRFTNVITAGSMAQRKAVRFIWMKSALIFTSCTKSEQIARSSRSKMSLMEQYTWSRP